MKNKRRGWRTAEEVLADPQIRAQQAEAARRIREGEELARQEEAPLRSALVAVGVKIDMIWDLVNTSESYDEAVPILIQHLKHSYSARTREGIARALTVKAAKPFCKDLIELFKAEDDATNHYVKWAIGNALTVAAGQDFLPEIIQLALDRNHGRARSILLLILKRSKRPEAREALMRLVSDPDVGEWAKKYVSSEKPQPRQRH